MAISSANAAAAPKTRKVETLLSGTSWTVPAGVEYVNATLIGGGGGAGRIDGSYNPGGGHIANGGQKLTTTVTTTPGASITYAIGAGGTANNANDSYGGGTGGTTTFTGATSASGGGGGGQSGFIGLASETAGNQATGAINGNSAQVGGSGSIILEYWV